MQPEMVPGGMDGGMAPVGSYTDEPRQLKVFIGGLSQNSSRESLNAYFGQYDQFVDCYVMRDGSTGRSRGFAFANFTDEGVMDMMLQQPEHHIDGVPVTLSLYTKGKGGKGQCKGGYHGKGRPPMQMQAGPPMGGGANLHSVQNMLGAVNNLLAQQPGGAQIAGALNNAVNAVLHEQQQRQQPMMMQQQRPMPIGPTGEYKIFVGGISQETTKESLSAYFSQYGAADAYIMIDSNTGRSRGFAFVNFQEEHVVNTVLQLQHEVDGVLVQCSNYRPGGNKGGNGGKGGGFVQQQQQYGGYMQQQPAQGMAYGAGGAFQSCKLFVASLAPSADETALTGAFSRYNPVQVTVCRDHAGQSKGFGIVEFGSPAETEQAAQMQPIIDGKQTEVTEYIQKSGGKGRPGPY